MSVRRLLEGKGRFVPAIRSDVRVQDVVDQLEADEAGALVVTDDNREILGIVSERDIVRGLRRHGRDVVDKPVRELMTREVITCDLEESMTHLLELMDRHQIRHVPVTKNRELHGIVTMLDVVRYRLDEISAEAEALKDYVVGRA